MPLKLKYCLSICPQAPQSSSHVQARHFRLWARHVFLVPRFIRLKVGSLKLRQLGRPADMLLRYSNLGCAVRVVLPIDLYLTCLPLVFSHGCEVRAFRTFQGCRADYRPLPIHLNLQAIFQYIQICKHSSNWSPQAAAGSLPSVGGENHNT